MTETVTWIIDKIVNREYIVKINTTETRKLVGENVRGRKRRVLI